MRPNNLRHDFTISIACAMAFALFWLSQQHQTPVVLTVVWAIILCSGAWVGVQIFNASEENVLHFKRGLGGFGCGGMLGFTDIAAGHGLYWFAIITLIAALLFLQFAVSPRTRP